MGMEWNGWMEWNGEEEEEEGIEDFLYVRSTAVYYCLFCGILHDMYNLYLTMTMITANRRRETADTAEALVPLASSI